jgi:hypothetical protein
MLKTENREIHSYAIPSGCKQIGTTVCSDGIARPVYRSNDCNSRGEYAQFVIRLGDRWFDYA